MKRMRLGYRQVIVLLLAIAFVFAGCSTKGSEGESPEGGTASQTNEGGDAPASETSGEEAGAATATNAYVEKYDPPIQISTVSDYTTLVRFEAGDDIDNNMWTRHIEETYGIQVKRKWSTTSASEFSQKTNLMIASGDLPDFFMATPEQFVQLHEAGLIEDLTEAYANHTPPRVKKTLEGAGAEVMESATLDGKLMGIPFTGLERDSASVLWVRKDWMDNLGLSEPKSMSDVLNISKAFTTQDPDGNNQHDTIGLLADKDFHFLKGFFNGYHAYNDIWIKDAKGGLAYSNIQPEMKQALEALQTLYAEGQLDPEFAVKNTEKAMELIGTGKAGMFFWDKGGANYPASANLANVEWVPYAVPSIDSEPVLFQHNLNVNGFYWVVRKGYEHPEALLKIMDAFVDKFYLTTSDDEYKTFVAPPGDLNPVWFLAPAKIYMSTDLEAIEHSKKVMSGELGLDQGTPNLRATVESLKKYKDGDQSLWWVDAQVNGSGPIYEQYLRNNQFMPNQFITYPTPAMTSKKTDLLDMMQEAFTKIIMGTAKVDEFDQFVSSWKRLGGDDITKEVNDWYSQR